MFGVLAPFDHVTGRKLLFNRQIKMKDVFHNFYSVLQ